MDPVFSEALERIFSDLDQSAPRKATLRIGTVASEPYRRTALQTVMAGIVVVLATALAIQSRRSLSYSGAVPTTDRLLYLRRPGRAGEARDRASGLK
jgi:hypothetical protein